MGAQLVRTPFFINHQERTYVFLNPISIQKQLPNIDFIFERTGQTMQYKMSDSDIIQCSSYLGPKTQSQLQPFVTQKTCQTTVHC